MVKSKKIIVYLVSVIFLIGVAVGANYVYGYFRYNKELTRYNTSNFSSSSNYLSSNVEGKVAPGSTVEYMLHYQNTGMQEVYNLNILIKLPEYFKEWDVAQNNSKEDGVDGGMESRSSGNGEKIIRIPVGSLGIEEKGSLKIQAKLDSPIDNGLVIDSPEVEFVFEKSNSYISKQGKFSEKIKPDLDMVINSSPDFSNSRIYFHSSKYKVIEKEEAISYSVLISNDGNMNAEEVEVVVKGLEFLEILDIKSTIGRDFFKVSKDKISLSVNRLDAGEKIGFDFLAKITPEAKNNQIINPDLILEWNNRTYNAGSVESIVRLYPSFENSVISLVDANGGFTISGDEISVKLLVKNSGYTAANNLRIYLVCSECLTPVDNSATSWNFDRIDVGDEINVIARLKVVEGITQNSYAEVSFKVDCDELKGHKLESSLLYISGVKPYSRGYIPIIALHGIVPHPQGGYEISVSNFEYLLHLLKSNGFSTITFQDLLNYLDYRIALPDKAVIITSDDGYRSIYQYAFPSLRKYNYTMTVFLATGYIGDSDGNRQTDEFNRDNPAVPVREMLIWKEIGEMSRYGIGFQSHGVTHDKSFDSMGNEESLTKMVLSKSAIEEHIRRPVVFIAWPFGKADSEDFKLLPIAGYRGAVNYRGGIEDVRSINLMAIRRIPIEQRTSRESYAELLNIK